MMTTLPDGSTVRITRALVEHRGTDGTLLAEREPTDTDLAALESWAAEQTPNRDAAWQAHRDDRALDPRRAEIRAARLRLQQIVTQGQAAADAATGVTKVHLQATVDLAAIVLELGRVVLRDAS